MRLVLEPWLQKKSSMLHHCRSGAVKHEEGRGNPGNAIGLDTRVNVPSEKLQDTPCQFTQVVR